MAEKSVLNKLLWSSFYT